MPSNQQPTLSHVDELGKANMVDVSAKPMQLRTARAAGHIRLAPETIALVSENKMNPVTNYCVTGIFRGL